MSKSNKSLAREGAQLPLAQSVEEFAAGTGLGRTLIYSEIRRGALKARKVGRRTLITEVDAREYLARLPLAAA
jgi:excisionase family DNA binding protein